MQAIYSLLRGVLKVLLVIFIILFKILDINLIKAQS